MAHTITTTTPITTTPPATRTVRSRRARSFLLGGVVGAMATFGIVAALDDSPPAAGAGDANAAVAVPDARSANVEMAEWARLNGLTGLSPASLGIAVVPDARSAYMDVANWARANGLTGLSPASVAAVPGD